MELNDLILVSADDHIIEPPNVFEGRVPSKYVDLAPRVVDYTNGEQRWVFEDRPIPCIASSAVAGRNREELGAEASRYSELRPGYYDPAVRVEDMNANGVLSSVNFPTLAGFAGELFVRSKDKDLALALVRAYNDWHIDEWCAPHPGRFIPLAILPLWDPQACRAEIKRVSALGARTVCLPENPAALGLPSVHRDYWVPILEALVEENMVVSMHIGTAGAPPFPSLDSPLDWFNSMINVLTAGAVMDWVFSPMLRQFPTLKISVSEGCIGWVPFMMERADHAYKNHRFWTYQDLKGVMPSEIMRRQFLYCFHEDKIGMKNRHDMGVELIAWECDYPHADSTWPRSPEYVMSIVDGMPKSEIDMVTHGNTLRFFDFDPFKHIPRERANVGSLRALSPNVVIEDQFFGGGRRPELDKDLNVLTWRALQDLQKTLSEDLVPVA